MARMDGKNPNTPTVPISQMRTSEDFTRNITKQFEEASKGTGRDTEALREALAQILKIFNEQNEALTKQLESRKKLLDLQKASLKDQQQYYKDEIASLSIQRKSLQAQVDFLQQKAELTEDEQLALKVTLEDLEKVKKAEGERVKVVRDIARQRKAEYDEVKQRYDSEIQKTDSLTRKQQKQLEIEQKKKQLKEDQEKLIDEINRKEEKGLISKEEATQQRQLVEINIDNALKKLENPLASVTEVLKTISSVTNKILGTLDSGITAAARDREAYQGKVTARLQGLQGVDFNSIADTAVKEFSQNTLVNQSKYLSSVASLTDKGIAYNLENRALIETIGEKLVSTFETTNATLLRLTRIQQSDLTVSQLGAEAQLTQFLNAMYQDTSYLNDVYDNVSETLLSAASLMSVDQATSFLYDAQKWLGSLYSMGVSSSGVQTIAQGLSYLGSGNVSALSSNAPLQTLIVQSLNKAGYNYADILNNGLTADTTNNLLKAMVENLQSIANNTSSKVLKSAWGNILGIDTTDLRAVTNLTAGDLVSIANNRTNYVTAISEAKNQLNQLDYRTFKSEQLDNFINNTLYGVGSTLANSTEDYLNYRLASFVQDVTGVQNGSGLLASFANSALNMAKLGAIANAFGTSAGGNFWTGLGEIWNYAKSTVDTGIDLFSGAPQKQGFLNWSQYTSRGDILQPLLAGGVATGLSYSGSMSQYGSSIDAANFAAQQEAVSASFETISDTTATIVRDASDIYHELFEAQTTPIKVKLSDIEKDAMDKLMLTGGGNYPVDIIDSDIDAIGQVLKTLPSVRTDDW